MLARLLQDWPLRRQIIVTLGVTLLIMALGAATFVRQQQIQTFQRDFEQQAQTLVAMLAATSLDAILSEDRPVLSTMLSQLATVDPQVEKISVFNEDDQLLSSWQREASNWQTPLAPRRHFSQNVSLADETFGRIVVTWNINGQFAAMHDQIAMVYPLALGLALLLGLLLLMVFDAIVTRPVQALHGYAVRLQQEREQAPLQFAGALELTSLASGLNELGHMLDLKAGIASAMKTSPRLVGGTTAADKQPIFADPGTLDLEELVEDSVAEQAEQAHAKGVEIITYLTPDLPRSVTGDRVRIRQVLCELVANAVRFTFDGEVRVHVECVDDSGAARTVRFSVIDTGIGLDARRPQGTADALSICRQLAEGMGGMIGAESQNRQGAVFWFEITLPEAAPLHVWRPEPALANRRILLVESHMHVREHLLDLLGFHGMLIDCEGSAAAGLACLRNACNAERLHDIVLFDVDLPDQEDGSFARCIAADPMFDSLQLVAMARHATDAAVSGQHRDQRLAGWTSRPVKRRELTRLLLDALGEEPLPAWQGPDPRKVA